MLAPTLDIEVKPRRRARSAAVQKTLPSRIALAAPGFRPTRIPALDGLRGLACLLVIGFHLGLPGGPFPGGYIGVDIFFVLSGFLITTLLLQEWERTGAIDLKGFFMRRVLRLMPALVTMLAACCVVALIMFPAAEAATFGKAAIINLLFQANRMDILGQYAVGAYLHTWSLAVEDKFYLLWPVALCAGLTQKFDRRWLVFFTALGIGASAGSRAWLHFNGRGGPDLYFGLDNRADALLAGCLISMLAVWNLLPQARWFRIALRLSAVVSWAMLTYTCFHATPQAPYLFRGVFTLIALGAAVCILDIAITPRYWASWVLEHRALVITGQLSYGLYLWHWPIMQAIFVRPPGCTTNLLGVSTTAAKLAIIPISFVVAGISYYCIERPFLRLRPSRTQTGRLPARNTETQNGII